MADKLRSVGRDEDVRINIDQEHEVSFWSKTFAVSPEELLAAVAKVGPRVKDVRDDLLLRD